MTGLLRYCWIAMEFFDPAARCYLICLENPTDCSLRVGSLGKIFWPAGWTYYAGRASRGWPTRIKRFTKAGDITNFWHVDYLVSRAETRLAGLLLVDWPGTGECRLSAVLSRVSSVEPLAPGFGASDCSAGCPAHAWTGRINPAALRVRLLEKAVPLVGRLEFLEDRCCFSRPRLFVEPGSPSKN